MFYRIFPLLAFVFSLFAETVVQAQTTAGGELAALVRSGFAQRLQLRGHGYSSQSLDAVVQELYRERGNRPLWVTPSGLLPGASQIRQAIEESEQDGLNPEAYFLTQILSRWNGRSSRQLAELELLLTFATVSLMADVSAGRADLRQIEAANFGESTPQVNLKAVARKIASSPNIGTTIRMQYPRHAKYQKLKWALAQYRAIQRQGGWKALSGEPALAPDWEHPGVIELVKRLKISGDLPAQQQVGELYDAAVEAGMKNFQFRHGIELSGWADEETLGILNIPVEARIRTLLVNLERWRRMDRDFTDEKQVFVNIPGFEVFALSRATQVLRVNAVVGEKYTATPLFSDTIKYIEFNPYWNIPTSIATGEVLPYLRQDRAYALKQNMKIFERRGKSLKEISAFDIDWNRITDAQFQRYAVRQEPGPWNVLGDLKFVFPNAYNVYLHETGEPEKLTEFDRALSHGCIRMESGRALAAFLLDSPKDRWDVARVGKQIDTDKTRNIRLPKPVPVHMTYQTAWVDADQTINFRSDVYARDRAISRVMFRDATPPPRR